MFSLGNETKIRTSNCLMPDDLFSPLILSLLQNKLKERIKIMLESAVNKCISVYT